MKNIFFAFIYIHCWILLTYVIICRKLFLIMLIDRAVNANKYGFYRFKKKLFAWNPGMKRLETQ
jgi:hypothetical protein